LPGRSEHPIDVEKSRSDKARTGVAGLDDVLGGSLTDGHVFLLEGNPGTGKTTIALRFLLEGAAAGERCLYTALSETEKELPPLMAGPSTQE
jgi:circadian clock protein KaiC